MRKLKYILLVVMAITVSILYFVSTTNKVEAHSVEAEPPPRVLTKVDTFVMAYDNLIREKIDSLGTVGSALAITCDGEIVYMKCFGVKRAGENDSIDQETLFRLASVSKTMTGVLAGKLSSENIIKLDDRVQHFLPGFVLKDSINTADLTVRNILSHSSGLVPHAYDNLVEAKVPMHTIIDSLHRVNISAAPGVLYGYQNVVFSLYDTLVRRKTGMTFPALMKKKVFEPFGMTRASVGYEPFKNDKNIAWPHGRSGRGYRVQKLNDGYYNTNPAAGVNASISDMASYLLALTSKDSVLTEAYSFDEVLSPQVHSPLKWNYLRKWDRVESKDYGLGWRIIGYKGMQVAYHGGYVRGYRSEVALCREKGIGIVYLTNAPNSVGAYSVPMFFDLYASMYLGDER